MKNYLIAKPLSIQRVLVITTVRLQSIDLYGDNMSNISTQLCFLPTLSTVRDK